MKQEKVYSVTYKSTKGYPTMYIVADNYSILFKKITEFAEKNAVKEIVEIRLENPELSKGE